MEETEKEILFVQMALDDARAKGNDKYVVPALIKLGLLQFQLATQTAKEKQKEKEGALKEADKHLNEAIFEGKKLKFDIENSDLILIRERLCSIAEHNGKYDEVDKQLGLLERLAKTCKDGECMRRTKNGLCFVRLKQKRWQDVFDLTVSQLEAYDEAKGWVEKEALRLFRFLADAINHLQPSDEISAALHRFRKDKRFVDMDGFKPIILRAACTCLNKRKDYKELCKVASDYAAELKTKQGSERQAAEMFRLSAIAYNNLGSYEEARKQAGIGKGVLAERKAQEDRVTWYLCSKEEVKALNHTKNFREMVEVMTGAEEHLEVFVKTHKVAAGSEGKEECTFYTNLGYAHHQLGNQSEALARYEKAINVAKETNQLTSKFFGTILTCGNIALEMEKTSWGIVFLGRFLQMMKDENEDLACKALVLRAKLFVQNKKYQDALDSLEEAWKFCEEPDPSKMVDASVALGPGGKNTKMALMVAAEMAEIYKVLDNNNKYCTWKETEIQLCRESGSPLETVNTKINFISNLIASNSADMKTMLQKHFREASELVKMYPDELKDCGEQLSKLYVSLLACDDLVDKEFSDKLLDSDLSAMSKFNIAVTEIKTHIGKGRLKDAEGGVEKLEGLVTTVHDEVDLLLIKATLATKKGELEAAGKLLEDAIATAGEGKDETALKLKASALKQSGGNLNIRGQYDQSLKRLQEAMAIYIEVGDKVGELGALSAIGYVYLDLKEDSRAESAFQQTLDFANSTGDKEALCNSLLDLGNLYINSREIVKAEGHVTRALKIAEDLKIEYNVARAYAAMCNIEFAKKDYKKSFEFANKAKGLLASSEDAVFAARLLANLGNIYDKLGNKGAGGSSTMEFHKKNLEFAKESGDNVLYCNSLMTLGDMVNKNIVALLEKEAEDDTGNHIYVTGDILQKALNYYNECLVVARRNQDLTSEGNALRGIAGTKRLEISSRMYVRKAIDSRSTSGRFTMGFRRLMSRPRRTITGRMAMNARRKAAGSMQREMNLASTQYLLWAAKVGELSRIKELIKLQKVDPDTSDELQYTALHLSAQEGHLPVVKYLIEDAKANAQCETVHFDTPYALALSRGRKEVSDYLKDIAGVLPFVKSKVMKEVEERRTSGITGDYRQFSEYHRLAWNGQISQDLKDHDEFDIFKRTTLMMAAYQGKVGWVKVKLDEDPASVVKKDTEDWNALHWCCAGTAGDVDAYIQIAELLLGVQTSILRDRDTKGLKPYQLALKTGNKKVAHLLQVRYQARMDNFLLPLVRSASFLFIMMLYGFFFPLFVTVGYLRRRRIARILGKIPQTCFQILSPSQKMVFQKAQRIGLNERVIFFLVLPFFLFMWVYPTVLVLGILPSMGDDDKIRGSILYLLGVYYVLIALFLFFSTIKCFHEKELRNVRHPRKRIRMKILPNDFRTSGTRAVINVVRIVICVFDFLAFANFGIPKNLLDIVGSQSSDEYSVLDEWKGFGSQIILDFRRNTFVYSFWLGVFTVGVWFLLSTYLGSSMVILHNKKLGKMFPFVQPDFFSKIPGLSSIVPILAVAAVLPVSSIFFRALDCAYVSQGDLSGLRSGTLFFQQRGVDMSLLQLPPHMDSNFNLVAHCAQLGINETALLPVEWQHCPQESYTVPCSTQFLNGLENQKFRCCPVTECPKGFGSCLESQRDVKCWGGEHNLYSLVGLTYLMYYIPSCVVIGIYFMEPDEDVNDIRFTGAYMMLEIALKWIMSLLYTFFDRLPIITQIGCITVTGALAYANYRIQPCKSIWSMNHYRSSAYALNCWIAVSALVGVILKQKGVKAASVVGIEVSIWIIMLVLGGGLIVVVTLMIHASKLKVPISKLFSKVMENSKNEAIKERRETEMMKANGGPGVKNSVVLNPLSSHESAGQRLHAMTMDIELAQFSDKTKVGKTSIIKTENPLSRSPMSSIDETANPVSQSPRTSVDEKANPLAQSPKTSVDEKANPLASIDEQATATSNASD
ncbi:hypothetical protein HOP50_18g83130 [Chloropicon primus]|uniref:Uncharacterized protein n=2 Tax=Chloropicon primus TaxID=1764295 RepID=A0A5B8N125_9CHLO|nr:hypothetical protein A3770_18p82900 [Chloropicon primus]UPR04967.1 hypothetical protein HOP50_18g83130 [Chloropicon primus]|eukprot:QDZ25772.1 hypothetical protein A3770_18p82900 [Chloropicon primus]